MFCDRVVFSFDACPLPVFAPFTAVLFYLRSTSLLLADIGTSSVVRCLILVGICPFFFPDCRLIVFLLNVCITYLSSTFPFSPGGVPRIFSFSSAEFALILVFF
jgi:hypothetical protein